MMKGLAFVSAVLLVSAAACGETDPREQGYYTAAELCAPHVETRADYNFRWIDEPFSSDGDRRFRFYQSNKTWYDDEDTFTYYGDNIEMVNAFGTWIRHTYSCRINIVDQTMINGSVSVNQGILEPLPQ